MLDLHTFLFCGLASPPHPHPALGRAHGLVYITSTRTFLAEPQEIDLCWSFLEEMLAWLEDKTLICTEDPPVRPAQGTRAKPH